MENTIEQIKGLVNELNLQKTTLMDKPTSYQLRYLRTDISKGKFIKSSFPEHSDPTYWYYPNGVDKKIEDDKTYKVWFEYRDAADPYDSTTWYHVKYIEEVPADKFELVKYLEELLRKLK